MAKALITAAEHGSLSEEMKKEYQTVADEKSPHKGKYLLTVTEADGFELLDARTLKQTVSASRTDTETVRRELGQTKAQLEASQVRVAELEKIDPQSEAAKMAEQRVQSVTAQMKAAHEKELSSATGTITKLDAGLRKALIDSAVVSAITEHKGRLRLLKPALMAECDIKTRKLDDGQEEYYAVVLDDARNPRIADAAGNIMTISQRVAEMKTQQDFADAFDSEEARGTGRNQPARPAGKPAPVRQGVEKTSLQKITDGLSKLRNEAA
ncbi:MAG: hypothetical protein A2Z99_08320 [Treponema sp. GWB1_62_6]|nr:MAG: hypothetical protein A2Z99_08320 [Treponema sp. GWB1_62_6]